MTVHATLRGTITDIGGENANERGFDWDYDSGAPYAHSWTETDSYGAESFSHQVTGLTEGVTVYFRAKAHNSAGWGYGGEKSFVTPKKKAKPASIIPLMKVLDFLQTKPFSKRFPKFKPRLVA